MAAETYLTHPCIHRPQQADLAAPSGAMQYRQTMIARYVATLVDNQ